MMSPAHETPGSTAIRMIAYARHNDACTFVTQMTGHIWPLLRQVSWPVTLITTIVTTKEQMLTELQAASALTLVSAHGPAPEHASVCPRIGTSLLRTGSISGTFARPASPVSALIPG